MQIPVLLEPLKGHGYRARAGGPVAATAKGDTKEEALAKLRTKIQMRLNNGAEIVGMEVGTQPDPWLEFAGMFKDDPLIDEWVQSMAEYRKKVDEDPNDL